MVLPTREVTAIGGKIRGEVTGVKFNIQLENPERYLEMMSVSEDFQFHIKNLFLQTTFTIHKYLIRISPLDTGELRGGWTGILKRYNQDFAVPLLDSSLYDSWKSTNKTPEGREYHFSMDAVEKGASQSSFEELPFDITVVNNVPQADYLEFGTSKIQGRNTVELARYKGEYYFNEVFNRWLEQISQEGKVIEPEPQLNKQITN